jgi:hypothetical protein
VASTHYTTDGSDPSLSSPLYSGPFNVVATTTVKYRSWDVAGNVEVTRSQLIRIDAAAPTVTITAPAGGSSFSRGTKVGISANASDTGTGTGAASGVGQVAFYIDGVLLDSDNKTPFQTTWNTRQVTLGQHTITAVATDVAGNPTTSAPVTVTIT